jgi:hypothetical protein
MSRMRLVTIVLLLAACGEVRQSHRWPDHRRDKDAAITALEARATSLEARIKQLEQAIGSLQHPPQPALPSPGP